MATWRKRAGLILSLAALAGGGCALLKALGLETGSEALTFPHAKHGEAQDLECATCHSKAAEAAEAGMPTRKKCMTCHESIDEEKPPERKIDALFLEDKGLWANVTDVGDEVVFSHKTHAEGKVACADCHQGIEQSTKVTSELRVTMERCVGCHAGKKAGTDCAACHKEIREDAPPPSHRMAWKKLHGLVSADGDLGGEKRCTLCHTETSCSQCHQSEPPASHTAQWRQIGHGVAAETDRRQCSVCHEASTCDRCHQETAPRTHTGSWGAPVDRHCTSCHFPLASESCGLCHEGTPSHSLATPKPAWHNAGMNCRQCHGVTQPLPHVDDGSDCNMCHQ